MKSNVSIFTLALMLLGSACGVSPILNHADADTARPADQYELLNCPLAFQSLSLCASLTWVDHPRDDEGGVMALKFWKANDATPAGPYVTPPGTPRVYLWMPDHGHGSSPVKLTRTDTGEYLARDIFFIMPGKWEIRVQLKNGSQVLGEAALPHVAP